MEIFRQKSFQNEMHSCIKKNIPGINKAILEELRGFMVEYVSKNPNSLKLDESDLVALIMKAFKNRKDPADRSPVDIKEMMKYQMTTDNQLISDAVRRVDENGMPLKNATLASSTSSITTASFASATTHAAPSSTTTDVKSFLGLQDIKLIKSLLSSGVERTANICLDTKFRSLTTDGTSSFQWRVDTDPSKKLDGAVIFPGSSNRNIIKLRASPIRVPYSENNSTQNTSGLMTLLIEELSSQSVITNERNFHFMYKISFDGQMIDLTPIPDPSKSWYTFPQPISLDMITISFGNPFIKFRFDNDRATIVTVLYTNPARFTTDIAHKLVNQDDVYFSKFTTADPTTDVNLIQQVNRTDGWNIHVINDTTFDIDSLDLTSITSPTVGLTFSVYFGPKRMALPFEIVYT